MGEQVECIYDFGGKARREETTRWCGLDWSDSDHGPGSIKCWEILEQLRNWGLLKKG
jgi:hypothetical protein